MSMIRFPQISPVSVLYPPLLPLRFGYWGTDQHVENAIAIIKEAGDVCEWVNPHNQKKYRFLITEDTPNGFKIQRWSEDNSKWVDIGDVDKTRQKQELRYPESARLHVVHAIADRKKIAAVLHDFLRAHGKGDPRPSSRAASIGQGLSYSQRR